MKKRGVLVSHESLEGHDRCVRACGRYIVGS